MDPGIDRLLKIKVSARQSNQRLCEYPWVERSQRPQTIGLVAAIRITGLMPAGAGEKGCLGDAVIRIMKRVTRLDIQCGIESRLVFDSDSALFPDIVKISGNYLRRVQPIAVKRPLNGVIPQLPSANCSWKNRAMLALNSR